MVELGNYMIESAGSRYFGTIGNMIEITDSRYFGA